MPEPYVREFLMHGEAYASVILDLDDYLAFCDELKGIYNQAKEARVTDEQIETLKQAKHLPLMVRGTLTQQFFDRWGVEANKMGVMVRGQGKAALQRLLDNTPETQEELRRMTESN